MLEAVARSMQHDDGAIERIAFWKNAFEVEDFADSHRLLVEAHGATGLYDFGKRMSQSSVESDEVYY